MYLKLRPIGGCVSQKRHKMIGHTVAHRWRISVSASFVEEERGRESTEGAGICSRLPRGGIQADAPNVVR